MQHAITEHHIHRLHRPRLLKIQPRKPNRPKPLILEVLNHRTHIPQPPISRQNLAPTIRKKPSQIPDPSPHLQNTALLRRKPQPRQVLKPPRVQPKLIRTPKDVPRITHTRPTLPSSHPPLTSRRLPRTNLINTKPRPLKPIPAPRHKQTSPKPQILHPIRRPPVRPRNRKLIMPGLRLQQRRMSKPLAHLGQHPRPRRTAPLPTKRLRTPRHALINQIHRLMLPQRTHRLQQQHPPRPRLLSQPRNRLPRTNQVVQKPKTKNHIKPTSVRQPPTPRPSLRRIIQIQQRRLNPLPPIPLRRHRKIVFPRIGDRHLAPAIQKEVRQITNPRPNLQHPLPRDIKPKRSQMLQPPIIQPVVIPVPEVVQRIARLAHRRSLPPAPDRSALQRKPEQAPCIAPKNR